MASETLITITEEDKEWARQLSREKYILDTKFERNEGRRERNREIAINLLAKGSTPEFVQEITGLDLEAIEKLGK